MIEITPYNLEKCRYGLETILGEQFINEIEDFEPIGLNWFQALRTETAVHPFAKWWRSFNQDIERSIETNKLHLSEHSLRILDLFSVLDTIKNLPNIGRILDSIKDRNKFYSACFEAYIAANYCNKGFYIEIVDEMSAKGIKTSDLVLKINEEPVYIECKNLEDSKLKESPQWTELMNRLSKALIKYKRCWEIDIFASGQITGREKELILSNIVRDIKQNKVSNKSDFGKFKIQYSKLAEWNQEFFGPGLTNKKGEIGSVNFEIRIRPDGIPVNKNVHTINIYPYVEKDISNRLISEFKKAVKQIPKEGPGIIHIGIPYKIGSQSIEIIDRAYLTIYKKINKHSGRVNAIVISSTIVENDPQFPFSYNHYIIPNMETYSQLPSDFSILGTNDLGIPISDNKQGTIEFNFKISEWNNSRSFYIFNHLTNDGKFQLRVWRTWADRLRMDLVTPSTGRIFVESERIKLNENEEYVFAGTWNENEALLYINGDKKGFKNLYK